MQGHRKPLKVAILIQHFTETWGAGRYCIQVLKHLKPGYEIHVFAQTFSSVELPGAVFHRVPLCSLHPRWLNLLWFWLYTRWCTLGEFDVIHSHEMIPSANMYTVHCVCFAPDDETILTFAQKFKKILATLNPRNWIYRWFEKRQFTGTKQHKKIVVVSKMLQRNIQKNYALEHKDFILAPPSTHLNLPIDENGLIKKEEARHRVRAQLKIPENMFVILFVSNDFETKGLSALLEAFAKLNKPDCFLCVVGKGDIDRFHSQAVRLNISPHVQFFGQKDHVDEFYIAADIFVHPTRKDTFSIAVLEALHMGLPVIVSDAEYAGISEWISNEAILLKDPSNVDALTDFMNKLYCSEILREELSQRGRELAQKLTWTYAAEQIACAYDELAARTN